MRPHATMDAPLAIPDSPVLIAKAPLDPERPLENYIQVASPLQTRVLEERFVSAGAVNHTCDADMHSS